MKKTLALFTVTFLVVLILHITFISLPSEKVTAQPQKKPTPDPQQLKDHAYFHYPSIEDYALQENHDKEGKLKAVPYLTLPFAKSTLEKVAKNKENLYELTEGWTYSEEELAISKALPLHGGVDYYVPYGTEVVSPVDGYIFGSYQTKWKYDENGEIVKYKGEPIRFGLGYFVYIYVPSVNRIVEIAHLADIDESIPFQPPTLEGEDWIPPTQYLKIENFTQSDQVIKIKKGDVIGKVGYSGLTMGEGQEYSEEVGKPVYIDPKKVKSWDEPHIHFEEFLIHQETGGKGWQRDPYAIYKTYEFYPTMNKKNEIGKDQLWLLDENKMPRFAKE